MWQLELIKHRSRVLTKVLGRTRPNLLCIKVRQAMPPEMVVNRIAWQQASVR